MPEGEVVDVWPPKAAHLLHHKPSKAQIRKAKASALPPTPPPSGPSSRPMASSSAPASSSGATPPVAPKKSFVRRILPFLLAANFVVGAYVLLRTRNKQPAEEAEATEEAPTAPAVSTEIVAQEKGPGIQSTEPAAATTTLSPAATNIPPPASIATINVLPSVLEDEQRQLFRWILEEKRKMKVTSAAEKKKIDEEKALLKHFIRSGSIPSL